MQIKFNLIIFGVILLLFIIIFLRSIVIVKTNHVALIEFFGSFHKIQKSGLSIIMPYYTVIEHIDMREKYIFIKPQNIITRDNVNIDIDGILIGSCFDSYKFFYKVENTMVAIENIAHTKLRAICGQMSLLDILVSRNTINERLLGDLNAIFQDWGFNVVFVEIKDIVAPKNIKEIMSKQLEADMERKRIMLLNEGEFQGVVMRAEAEKEAAKLKAQALLYSAEMEAKIIEQIINVLNASPNESVRHLILINYIKAFQILKEGSQNNFVLSLDMQKLLDMLNFNQNIK